MVKYNKEMRGRRSIRLNGYDYAREGAYYITVCTYEKKCLFADIADDVVHLNVYGKIAHGSWEGIEAHFPHIELDAYVVMPNHIHGIVVITRRGTACRALDNLDNRFGKPVPGSLATIIRSFKSAATKLVNEINASPGAPLWQRNYYEHIIRDEEDLNRIRDYIEQNPLRWNEDEYYMSL